jgi:hypothetical protein
MEISEAINSQLAYLYSNGKGEAGLESGSDIGLPSTNYIRIPKGLKKPWAGRIKESLWVKFKEPLLDVKKYEDTSKPSDFVGMPGWITDGKIRIHKGKHEGQVIENGKKAWVQIDEFHIEPHTAKDMKMFYTANIGHINDEEIPEEHHFWMHAVRMWGVFGGLVTSSKNGEFLFVDDPLAFDSRADEFASFAIKYAPNAWTAAAARTTSWKKTNHCTGGTPAMGLPRRWMNKEGYWPSSLDRATKRNQEILATSAFYTAAHGISVHAVLAQFTPDDDQHWCILVPDYGMIWEWSIGESIKIRMIPREQVAGVSMVSDSMVVLKIMVSEGIAPVLANINQANALKEAFDVIKENGMACGIYKKWYFDGYPGQVPEVNFSQRDPSFFDLISELAIIATKFYANSTIAQSPTLQNVAVQSTFEHLKSIWANAAIIRQDISSSDLTSIIGLIRGTSQSPFISNILSEDVEKSNSGRATYNQYMDNLGRLVGISHAKRLEILKE